MKYIVGENVPLVFDTAPNVTGLTDMEVHGVDVVNDTDLTVNGPLTDPANGITVVKATESAASPGTYKHMIAGLPVGTYLLWMTSPSNGATSNKVLVTVAASATGDPFYGQAQA